TLPGKDVITALAFGPGGTLAAGADDGSIQVWAANRSEGETLRGHRRVVRGLAFSARGSLLYSGSEDGTIKVWDLGTRQERSTLFGHESPVGALAYSAPAS